MIDEKTIEAAEQNAELHDYVGLFHSGARWAEAEMSSILSEAVELLRDMMYMQGSEFEIENRVNTLRRASEFIEKYESKL